MKLIKKQKVNSYMADINANLSIIGIFQMIEAATTEFMGLLNLDSISTKKNYNAVWVFTKNRVRILNKLVWNSDFTVEAFISKVSLAKIYVDTIIKDEEGNLAVIARVEMCALDIETGSIRKTISVGIDENIKVEKEYEEINFTRFENVKMNLVETVKVRSSNIDFIKHTNNVEYIRFLINTYTTKELIEKNIEEIEVVYVNQSYEYDNLEIYKKSENKKDIFEFKKDGQTIVKSEINFK